MIKVKGFLSISKYYNNISGQVNKLFELSSYSLSFSRNVQVLSSENYKQNTLYVFSSINDILNSTVNLNSNSNDNVSKVSQAFIDYSLSNIRPFTKDKVRTYVQNFLADTITNLLIGELVDDGNFSLPEWFSFLMNDGTGISYKIWLSDSSFRNQYDEYEMVIVPPISNIDNLFNAWNVVTDQLNATSVTEFLDIIETNKSSIPSTYTRILSYDLYNKLNPTVKVNTNWGIIIYGNAGDNMDVIKNNLVEYVSNNSSVSQTEWEAIIPGIFRRTEFIIIPRWDKISIENLNKTSVIYSSWSSPTEYLGFLNTAFSEIPKAHAENKAISIPFDYKAIMMIFIAGETNQTAKSIIEDMFYDYIPVNSSSPDFGRMNATTCDWIIMLEKLLLDSEKMTLDGGITHGSKKAIRNNKLYASQIYDGVNYLMAAKSNQVFA